MAGVSQGSSRASQCTSLEPCVGKWRLQRLQLRDDLAHLLSCQHLPDAMDEQCAALGKLCTDLIDYISTGHFEIYGRALCHPAALDPATCKLYKHIFHCIGISTDLALGFNDRYDYSLLPLPPGLPDELSRLTRSLLLRFALEEQLITLCVHLQDLPAGKATAQPPRRQR